MNFLRVQHTTIGESSAVMVDKRAAGMLSPRETTLRSGELAELDLLMLR